MVYYIVTAILVGVILDIILLKYLKLKKYPFTVMLSIITILILTKTFDNPLMIIKGFLFSQILIFTALTDFKTKIIPITIHILILLISLINMNICQSIARLIIVPLPFILAVILKDDSIGGGDIKFMASIGFLLGVRNGYLAGIIGLIIAVAVNGVYYRMKRIDKNVSFPLATYLSIGSFIAYLS